MNPSSETKQCDKCHEMKPIDAFTSHRGFTWNQCKRCVYQDQKDRRALKRLEQPAKQESVEERPYYTEPPPEWKIDHATFKEFAQTGPNMNVWKNIKLPEPLGRNRRNQLQEHDWQQIQYNWGRQPIEKSRPPRQEDFTDSLPTELDEDDDDIEIDV